MYGRLGSSPRSMEALGQAHIHWQTHHGMDESPPPRSLPFTIAISREAGAGGAVIARELGTRLGWPVYDRELVQQIAGEMGLHTRLVESVDERRENWLNECVDSFLARPGVSKSAYVHRLVKTLLSLAAHGECVIVGRGAAQLLPLESTLRVRLVGPLEARVQAAQHRLGLSPEEARSWVKTTDQQRHIFVSEHFHKDVAEASSYDVILNTSRFSDVECAALIIESMRRLKGHVQVSPANQVGMLLAAPAGKH